jgi:hypothetical protein
MHRILHLDTSKAPPVAHLGVAFTKADVMLLEQLTKGQDHSLRISAGQRTQPRKNQDDFNEFAPSSLFQVSTTTA